MSILSVLPLSGKTDSTAAAAPAEEIENPAADDASASREFDAELDNLPDALAPLAVDPGEAAEATAEPLITSEDPLEAMLQSWSGISAEVAEMPATDPEATSVISPHSQMVAASDADTILPADMRAKVSATGQVGDQAADMAETAEAVDAARAGPATPADAAPVEKLATSAPRPTILPVGEATAMLIEMDAGATAARASESLSTTPDALASRAMPAPTHVIRQISDAFVATTGNQIDIALSPEELGRIRMTISGREGGQHVIIWAERPEVLEQLRRNATTLMQEFSDAGMEDMSFEFRDDRPDQRDDDWRAAQIPSDGADASLNPILPQPQAYTHLANGPRIDIRI